MKSLLILFMFLSAAAHAQNNNGCFDNAGLKCQLKPGLQEGQIFDLKSNILVPLGGWTYFANSRSVTVAALRRYEGRTYCAVGIATDQSGAFHLPKSLRTPGLGVIPMASSPYELVEISWYVDTVFFKAKTEKGEDIEFVVYCGSVKNHDLTNDHVTSIQALKKDMGAILTPKK